MESRLAVCAHPPRSPPSGDVCRRARLPDIGVWPTARGTNPPPTKISKTTPCKVAVAGARARGCGKLARRAICAWRACARRGPADRVRETYRLQPRVFCSRCLSRREAGEEAQQRKLDMIPTEETPT